MRRLLTFTVVIGVVIASMAIYFWRAAEPIYHVQSYVFGTLVDITIYGETDAHAATVGAQILDDFQALHHQLHAWKAPAADTLNASNPRNAGELMAVNTAFANHQSVNISARMATILQDAQRLSALSQGLFNPAIGHLIGTWGFQRDTFGAVSIDDAVIQQWLAANPVMADIEIDAKALTAISHNPAVKLDLGGYAKGYALDLALATLKRANVKHALINIGGNIIALGQHGDKAWRVGIQHPRQPNAIATVALPSGWAIGTSGDYQRFFTLNGTRYCHIIDPRTGYPVQHTQAVTVLVPPQPAHFTQAGVLSDVASKPIFIADVAAQSQYAHVLQVTDVMVIDQSGQIRVSPNMAKKLTWLNADEVYSLIQ